MEKTIADAIKEMSKDCGTCEDQSCPKHDAHLGDVKHIANDTPEGERLATQKIIKVTVEAQNEDGTVDTVSHDGFCMAGIVIIGDNLEGNFEAMNIATGAFSNDRIEAVIQGLAKLQEVLKQRRIAMMLASLISK